MEESTDSDFTITYDEVPRSFDQVSGEEDVGIGADMTQFPQRGTMRRIKNRRRKQPGKNRVFVSQGEAQEAITG